MDDDLDIPVAPPKEALDYFRKKGFAPSFAWQDVWQEEHGRAFTVAKAMSRDVLETIRGAVDRAIADGTTLDDFRKELTPTLQKLGWWGRQEMADPLTGEVRDVQLGSPRRLRTIFEVNLRTAYQAGRWERIERQKGAFPFLRYVHSDASRNPRPQHVAWDGTIKPVDDPWWDTHYGPCGWGCKCTAVAYSRRQLDKNGWTVTKEPPAFDAVSYRNRRTGEVSEIEAGIDPGWSYNVGKSQLAGLAPPPLPPRPDAPASTPNGAKDVAAFFESFGLTAATARKGRVFTDAGDWPLGMSLSWFKRDGETNVPRGDLAAAGLAITDPQEIWWAWTAARDGSAMLVRRYLRMNAAGNVSAAVDVGRDGWRVALDGEDMDALRVGRLAWSAAGAASQARAAARRFLANVDQGERMASAAIGAVPPGAARQLGRLGLATPPAVGLDAGHVVHIRRRHGDDSRGQKPVEDADISDAAAILATGTIARGNPPASPSGAPRVYVTATIDGARYAAVFEVRRAMMVLVSLRKR
ncbi:phage minor head protein [Sphingomonas sp. TX0522]|uniref:phage minor head protein n=1 Tax=Sphingomonas sp. TX0522 TaxID=2479205 RepID=UPI0018DF2FF9|nr:phage minor head protein [Sphingomonas sp. TX0522]MBI0530084.1 hypothetical protein [Sphingomonas sp. TX0522]